MENEKDEQTLKTTEQKNETPTISKEDKQKLIDDVLNAKPINQMQQAPTAANASAVTSLTPALVLAIMSIVLVVINFFGVPLAHIIGLILATVSMSLVNKNKDLPLAKPTRILAIIGIVLGLIAFMIGLLTGIYVALMLV